MTPSSEVPGAWNLQLCIAYVLAVQVTVQGRCHTWDVVATK